MADEWRQPPRLKQGGWSMLIDAFGVSIPAL